MEARSISPGQNHTLQFPRPSFVDTAPCVSYPGNRTAKGSRPRPSGHLSRVRKTSIRRPLTGRNLSYAGQPGAMEHESWCVTGYLGLISSTENGKCMFVVRVVAMLGALSLIASEKFLLILWVWLSPPVGHIPSLAFNPVIVHSSWTENFCLPLKTPYVDVFPSCMFI